MRLQTSSLLLSKIGQMHRIRDGHCSVMEDILVLTPSVLVRQTNESQHPVY